MKFAKKLKKLKKSCIQITSIRIFKTDKLTKSKIKFIVREELDKFCDGFTTKLQLEKQKMGKVVNGKGK